jgi:hypothetical protein
MRLDPTPVVGLKLLGAPSLNFTIHIMPQRYRAEIGIASSNYTTKAKPVGDEDDGATGVVVSPQGHTVLTVVENTEEVHNLVVCTLCSCYPGVSAFLP